MLALIVNVAPFIGVVLTTGIVLFKVFREKVDPCFVFDNFINVVNVTKEFVFVVDGIVFFDVVLGKYGWG